MRARVAGAALAVVVVLAVSQPGSAATAVSVTISGQPVLTQGAGYQYLREGVLPICPGIAMAFDTLFTSPPDNRLVGTITQTGMVFSGACTVLEGDGWCSHPDENTLMFDVTVGGSGQIRLAATTVLPAGSAREGEVCLALDVEVYDASGELSTELTLDACQPYYCPQIPLLGRWGLLALILLLAVTTAIVVQRRVGSMGRLRSTPFAGERPR